MKEYVVLVDSKDQELGIMEKIEAHEKALLHRAVSVFIFNEKRELLLQRRAAEKYHSPGLWTNTACTHPRPEETILTAAERRLQEEMGLTADLKKCFDFIYKAQLDREMTEHEYDHVFVGVANDLPEFNPEEVMDYQYLDEETLLEKISQNPDHFTYWFRKIIRQVLEKKKPA